MQRNDWGLVLNCHKTVWATARQGLAPKAHQRWLYESIPQAEWKHIREAIQRNWVFGNNKFKEDIENLFGRKFEIKKAGRRPKI